MSLNQFVNTGEDIRTLDILSKSMGDMPEDLVKSMNKSGLVQKEVQVRGKNGKMFTRRQWVKSGEAAQSSKPSEKEPEEKYEDDEYGNYTAADQKKAHTKAKELASKYGGKEVKKLGNFGYAFTSDYETCKKVAEDLKLDVYTDGYSSGAGFDFGKETPAGNIFCNQGGFQEDDNIYIGVSYNEL